MEALACADHPTAGELYEIIRADNPTISRGTVYRVLSGFAEQGAVLKLQLLGSDVRFDARTCPHAHAHCVCCGKIFDVDLKDSSYAQQAAPEGFEIISAHTELVGRCRDCSAKQN